MLVAWGRRNEAHNTMVLDAYDGVLSAPGASVACLDLLALMPRDPAVVLRREDRSWGRVACQNSVLGNEVCGSALQSQIPSDTVAVGRDWNLRPHPPWWRWS